MQSYLLRLASELTSLKDRDQSRILRPPFGHDFCSNDYLALARHQKIRLAVKGSVDIDGYGSTSSRFIRGESAGYDRVQGRLAQLKGCESTLLFSSGYAANLGTLSSLINKNDLVFSDQLNHASIIDGLKLSGAHVHIYPHTDLDYLKNTLEAAPKNIQKFLVTESLFSMDGDIAPLDLYVQLAKKYGVLLIVDESHAVGLYGKRGAGLVEQFGVTSEILLSINGLGKAFGCYGGFVAGSSLVIEFLVQKARTLMFATALPPLALAAIDAAIDLVTAGDLQAKLFANVRYLSIQIKSLGLLDPDAKSTPIIPLVLHDNWRAQTVAFGLEKAGFDVKAIRPPTVPQNQARLRITANVAHTIELMDRFIDALRGHL